MKSPSAAAVPLRTRAYEHVHAKVLSGELAPGAVVSEQSIASELGMSRTPVREAIRNLERDGFLEPVPRYGTVVRGLDRRDLGELYELREALEPFAVAKATGRLTSEDLATLRRCCAELRALDAHLARSGAPSLDAAGMRRLLAADLGFHLTLLRAAANGRLEKIVSDSRLLTGVFGARRQEHTRRVLQQTCNEHDAILDAAARGDGRSAARFMTAHIRASRRQAIEAHDREPRPSKPAIGFLQQFAGETESSGPRPPARSAHARTKHRRARDNAPT